MPIMACRTDDKPGYKYGENGHCYTYAVGNERSRKAAKRKAMLQGAAIEASKARAAGRERYKVEEFDNSLNDFIDRVRSAFDRQFGLRQDSPSGMDNAWCADVFEDHIIVRVGDKYYRVGMDMDADVVVFDERADWEEVRLSYVAEMLPLAAFREVMFVSEFKGKYPDVPIAAGVDYDALVDGDDDPVFVTLPIGKVNALSGNRRFYDEAFVAELERQVLANKPIGLMGHLSAEQRATEFPMEAVHWVGARRVGELLWGKGYVPKGEARERLRRYKATKKQIATSIDAIAEGVWDDSVSAYRMQADTLKLAQIDIAPADRAGIADLAAVPHFTTEMAVYGTQETEEEGMDREQIIREMTPADVRLLPPAVRDAVLSTAAPPPEVTQMTAIRETLGLTADDDPVASVAVLRREQDAQRAAQVVARIKELATTGDKAVKMESVRGLVIELVQARNPQSVQEAEAAYDAVIATDSIKRLLAAQVREMMGPPQGIGLNGQRAANGAGSSAQWWDDAPAKEG